jgi:hypothetical protein
MKTYKYDRVHGQLKGDLIIDKLNSRGANGFKVVFVEQEGGYVDILMEQEVEH